MAWADKKGIAVASGFKLQAKAPIDARFTCATTADLDELVKLNAVYGGLQVFCEADKVTYKYDGTKWIKSDTGKDITEELNKYLPLAGGTMTGNINFGTIGKLEQTTDGLYLNTSQDLYLEGNSIKIKSNDITFTDKDRSVPLLNTNINRTAIYAEQGLFVYDISESIGTVIANLEGNANTASRLETGRALTIGNTSKTFDGTSAITWSLDEIGVAPKAGSTAIAQVGANVTLGDGTTDSSIKAGSTTISLPKGTDLDNDDLFIVKSTTGSNTTNALTVKETGEVVASIFTGHLAGTADRATVLKNPRKINGTAFDGSTDITTATWGTARDITIGKTTKSVNGGTAVGWTLAEIGVAPSTGSTDIRQVGKDITLGKDTDTSSSITGGAGSGSITINKNTTTGGENVFEFATTDPATSTEKTLVTISDAGKVTASGGFAGNLTGNVTGNVSGNAGTATKLQTARKINGTAFDGSGDITTATWGTARKVSISGGATAAAVSVDGSTDVNFNVTSIDGTKITGIIPLSSIPKGAQERQITVADTAAMYKLTTNDVQLGDTVRVLNDGNGNIVMYYVVDESKLSTAEGYNVFSSGNAALAAEATKLQTARTITIGTAVKSFDGTANVVFTAKELGIDTVYLPLDGSKTMTGKLNLTNAGLGLANGSTVSGTASTTDVTDKVGTLNLIGKTAVTMKSATAGGATATVNETIMQVNADSLTVKNKAGSGIGTVIANLSGNATSATRLQTARTIALSGGVTGTATSFNGTANISIPVTAVSTSALYVPDGDVLILDGNAS